MKQPGFLFVCFLSALVAGTAASQSWRRPPHAVNQGFALTPPPTCKLFREDAHAPQTFRSTGRKLTPFWAQEYTGTEFVDDLLRQHQIPVVPTWLEIVDMPVHDHGELVRSLILDPELSANSAGSRVLGQKPYFDAEFQYEASDLLALIKGVPAEDQRHQRISQWLSSRRQAHQSQAQPMPQVINLSLKLSPVEWKALARLKDSLVVVASGNTGERDEAEPGEQGLTEEHFDNALLVGNYSASGLVHHSSSPHSYKGLVAPSGYWGEGQVTARGPKGLQPFDGTSGAAPQVSSVALVLNRVIPGITPIQARHLLMASATPLFPSHTPLLNSYRAVAMAIDIRKRCFPSAAVPELFEQCLDRSFDRLGDFKPELDAAVLNDVESMYPCKRASIAPRPYTRTTGTLCARRDALSALRKQALLTGSELANRLLACAMTVEGYGENARHYAALANANEAKPMAYWARLAADGLTNSEEKSLAISIKGDPYTLDELSTEIGKLSPKHPGVAALLTSTFGREMHHELKHWRPDTVRAYRAASNHPDIEIRAAAIATYVTARSKVQLPSEDREVDPRDLRAVSEPSWDQVGAWLNAPEPIIRRAAMEGLVTLNPDPRFTATVAKLYSSKSELHETRLYALNWLERAGWPQASAEWRAINGEVPEMAIAKIVTTLSAIHLQSYLKNNPNQAADTAFEQAAWKWLLDNGLNADQGEVQARSIAASYNLAAKLGQQRAWLQRVRPLRLAKKPIVAETAKNRLEAAKAAGWK